MSDKLPKSDTSEEIDIGQLFIYFERVIKKIGNLIQSLFGLIKWILVKAGVVLLILMNIVYKHYIIIGLATFVGYLIPYLLDKKAEPIYKSSIIVNQNYETGTVLYNYISTYNNLAYTQDSVALSRELKISESLASNIVRFEITDKKSENELYEDYYEHIKKIDSTTKRSFETYLEELNLENSPIQIIGVYSLDPTVFDSISYTIIDRLNENKFFKEVQRKELLSLNNRIKVEETIIKESDSLQKEYIELLNKYYGQDSEDQTRQSTINLNLTNNKDKFNTKEFELFKEKSKARGILTKLQDSLEIKTDIISLQKEFTSPIIIDNFYGKNKLWVAIVFGALAMLFFLIKEFKVLKLIDEYGTKENLLK